MLNYALANCCRYKNRCKLSKNRWDLRTYTLLDIYLSCNMHFTATFSLHVNTMFLTILDTAIDILQESFIYMSENVRTLQIIYIR